MCPLTKTSQDATAEREDREILEEDSTSRIEELKLWLRGLINNPDYFTTPPVHDIDDLHQALYLAAVEIVQRLDPELEANINMAGDPEYNVRLDEDDFYDTRKIDVEDLRDMGLEGVKRFTRERTLLLLVLVKDEIEWVSNEAKRLELHCRNARELRQAKLRSSFEYQPTPRKSRSKVANFRSIQNQNATPPSVSRVPHKAAFTDDDQEMLDVVEGVEKRGDSLVPPSSR